MLPATNTSHIERELLASIRGSIRSLKRFGRALANRAEPEFSLQTDVSIEDLVLPLEIGQFPDERMFVGSSQEFEMFSLFDFLVCQCVCEFDEDDVLLRLYVSSVALAGIVRQQIPESAEFGIAGKCLVLSKACNPLSPVPNGVVASFVNELKRHAIQSSAQYWDAEWVVASLMATALELTTMPSVKSSLKKELSDFLRRAEWQAALTLKRSDIDYVNEVQAMEDLLAVR